MWSLRASSRARTASIAPSWNFRFTFLVRRDAGGTHHWDKNMQLVLDVVTGEDFPTGRTIQLGLTSGAQTHTVFGRNEPAMIHYHRSLRAALPPRRRMARPPVTRAPGVGVIATIPEAAGPARRPARPTRL